MYPKACWNGCGVILKTRRHRQNHSRTNCSWDQFNEAGSDLNMRESVAPSRKNMASLKTDLMEITQVKEGAEAETASLRNMCKELGQEVEAKRDHGCEQTAGLQQRLLQLEERGVEQGSCARCSGPDGNITAPMTEQETMKQLLGQFSPDNADEMVRRLKILAHTFQEMNQADKEKSHNKYITLALHLSGEYFINNQSRDVQLLTACCLADILRILAPETPYKEPQQIKTISMFFISQLSGLKDPEDPAFKRYFCLLENLANVKSFNMIFDLEDCTEISVSLFSLMFRIVNNKQSDKVKNFMMDVLCPLLTEANFISNDLLDTILHNLVDPVKTQRKSAYNLAKELVNKTSNTLEPYIKQFFNQVLILGKADTKLIITGCVYDLIYELNLICPSVLLAVLPQLEFKLKSTDEAERMGSVSLLASMFSEKDSMLAVNHRQLWQAFLGRFNDISEAIRHKCVQYTIHFLTNHAELIGDITETLKARQHDSEETVRYEVVIAIVSTAKKDFDIVSRSEDLLNFLKEQTLDENFKIRKVAMGGLAMIYKRHLSNPHGVPDATKAAVKWIKDKILHGYYMPGIEDRLLVERLLNTCLVPYNLEPEERMKKLYLLFATIDENASKAFIEMQKHKMQVRKACGEMIGLHRLKQSEERDQTIQIKIHSVAKFLPDPVKVMEFIKKLSQHMSQDEAMLGLMEKVTEPEVSCKDSFEAVNQILKKLGAPIMTNLYYGTVNQLLERISSLIVDREAIQLLVKVVKEALNSGEVIKELGINPDTAGERGLRLLFVLSSVFPSHFLYKDVIKELLSILEYNRDKVAPLVLSILTFIGKHKLISVTFPELHDVLEKLCLQFVSLGTSKQAKQALKCMFMNSSNNTEGVFSRILEIIKEKLNSVKDQHFVTAIVALGHLAFHLPYKFPVKLKNLISRKIVKQLLLVDVTAARGGKEAWCTFEELCLETRSKVEGIKMMARWLCGLKTDEVAVQKTFRMLHLMIKNGGDLLEEGRPNPAERAWLRLAAGCAMLKIFELKDLGDQFSTEQYYNLGKLVTDPVVQVREQFLVKLHKGLGRGSSNLQNLQSYLTKKLQHSAPKKAATLAERAPMGPSMSTVSGQLASKSKLDMKVEDDWDTSTSTVVVVEELKLGKRARRGGGPETKRDKK